MPAQSLPAAAVPRMPASAVARLTPQPLPDQPATFLVCGVLAEDARVYVQPSGQVLLLGDVLSITTTAGALAGAFTPTPKDFA